MKELTKAEEQVMQLLWYLDKAFVREIIAEMPDPKPAYNTVSTIVRILERKGFVSHRAFGKSHQYYATVSKEEYKTSYFKRFLNGYFGDSFQNLVSFFVQKENMDIETFEKMMNKVKKDIEK